MKPRREQKYAHCGKIGYYVESCWEKKASDFNRVSMDVVYIMNGDRGN